MAEVRYGSVCSGIEAATVAWHGLGWEPAWFSEIEAFPCAVLAHHYPAVPNYGDMTKLAARIVAGEIEAPDLLVGGTPCQAFSVAGLRNSLEDARGNLSLTFCKLADAIGDVRRAAGLDEPIILWENVPGVLSTKDNAFGCFLAGLAGADDPIEIERGKWGRAGVVHGPRRRVAWCVLDAQYFGVAQRRRRVFVLAMPSQLVERLGDRAHPAEVLSIGKSLRRDTPTREQAREGAAATFSQGAPFSRTGNERVEAEAMVVTHTIHPRVIGRDKGGPEGKPYRDGETSYTLDTTGGGGVVTLQQGAEIGPGGGRLVETSPTLDARAKDGPRRNQLAPCVLTTRPKA